MNEIDAVLKELRDCAAKIIEIEENLRAAMSDTTKAEEELKAAGFVPSEVTLEEVRDALAEKSRAGYRAEVKALLRKYGAERVSALSADDYAAVVFDAGGIGNA